MGKTRIDLSVLRTTSWPENPQPLFLFLVKFREIQYVSTFFENLIQILFYSL